tara:strand:- start:175 stop:306 length:132 start_codon:yes stop_codon:yes gene_type:complete
MMKRKRGYGGEEERGGEDYAAEGEEGEREICGRLYEERKGSMD